MDLFGTHAGEDRQVKDASAGVLEAMPVELHESCCGKA
jgi:hypothetical protein